MRLPQDVKDSGIQWIGNIPVPWDVLPIKKFGKLITGMTPPTDNPLNYEADTEFPWVRPEDINESGIETVATKTLSRAGWECSREVRAPANLICCIGTIGKVGYIKKNSTSNQQITALESDYPARFLYYALQAARKELEVSATGNVVWILNSERLGAVKLPHPSHEQAVEIANFLDRETTKIDGLIGKQKKLVELLELKRQAVIYSSVTKGLNNDAALKESNISWIGQTPSHWVIGKVKNYYQVTLGKMLQPEPKKCTDKLVSYLRAANIQVCGVDISDVKEMWLSENELKKLVLQDGDILVSEGGDVGRCSIWNGELEECYFQNSINRVRPIGVQLNKFFYYWMIFAKNTGYIDILCNKSTIAHLTAEKLSALPMVFPPIKEQAQITNYLDKIFSSFDALILKSEGSIALLKEHRASLISAAVTGKIDVRESV